MDAGHALTSDRLSGFIRLLFGPIVWAIHFTVLYGAHTLTCALGRSGGYGARAATIIVIVATLVALALIAMPLLSPIVMRRRAPALREPVALFSFAQAVAALLALLSAIAVAWAGAAALIVAPCGYPS